MNDYVAIISFFETLTKDDGQLTTLETRLLVLLGLALANGIARLVYEVECLKGKIS